MSSGNVGGAFSDAAGSGRPESRDTKSQSDMRLGVIESCLGDIQSLVLGSSGVATDTPSQDVLSKVKSRAIEFVRQRDKWDDPLFLNWSGSGSSRTFLLGEALDSSVTMCLVSARKGHESTSHSHNTWAVLVGVAGEEPTQAYRPVGNTIDSEHERDDLQSAGRRKIEKAGPSVVIRPEEAVALSEDYVHSVGPVESEEGALVCHIYGQNLEYVYGRERFSWDGMKSKPAKPIELNPFFDVDFAVLPEFLGTRTLVGECLGRKARARLDLDRWDEKSSRVFVRVPGAIKAVDSSFLYGLFENSFHALGARQAFFEKYKLTADHSVHLELQFAIREYRSTHPSPSMRAA